MPENEKRRFTEALRHWAEAVEAMRASERAEAIATVEELEKLHLRRALHASALGKHHSGTRRSQG